ncbi:MAG TPA: NAD(P)H-hydrate dehydratase, partial [Bacteroidales bacterium]|nr:NAD(P)H-hydrate dehydratase [Bacteroidales bacterium]
YDSAAAVEDLEKFLTEKKINAVVFGPGIGREPVTGDILAMLLRFCDKNYIERLLIDGDGLFALKQHLEHESIPENLKNRIALTPHFGEASYLTGIDTSALKKNHTWAASEISNKINAVTLLKGPATVTTDGTQSYVNTTGTGAMATGGSGDVLSGICGALMARGCETISALAAGAFIHGLAGEKAAENCGKKLLRAGDIFQYIADALDSLD